MTGRRDEEMVAYALEIDPALLAFAPELLADLEVLGADVGPIVQALDEVGISGQTTVLDLGCGKGGVAIAIAAALGCQVVGVDLFQPFVDWARAAAETAGAGLLCRFVHGDIAALADTIGQPDTIGLADTIGQADAVVYAALGDVLGPLDVTMALIRRYAKPGGYVVVNDSYLRDPDAAAFPGFESYTDLAGTRRRLTSCGDELVLELLVPGDDGAEDRDEAELFTARAAALAARYPHLAPAFEDFARSQRDEYDYLHAHTGAAVWVVRRR